MSGERKEEKVLPYWQDPQDREGKYVGTHNFVVKDSKFTVDLKYTPIKPLGQGAYGVVCSARDRVREKKVAIKKIRNAFEDLVDAKRIVRELKLLRHFRHENVVGLVDLIPPQEDKKFDDVYVVMDLMDTDLHKIIYSKNKLSDDHIQYFIYQVLRGMKYIHSAGVLHRDLKPSNLLLNGNCDLKICDFGLARGVAVEADAGDLTEYVVTRWYRAPEVMCSCKEYGPKIDVWAIGCILAELHGRKPLFPGDDYIEQMKLIFGVIGSPSAADKKFITNEHALTWINGLDTSPKRELNTIYPTANPLALDLMEKMLKFDPNQRISVTEALAHPYLAKLHNIRTETTHSRAFDFSFENSPLPKERLQHLMWREIQHSRPHLRNYNPRFLRRSTRDSRSSKRN
jgi:serine/threonine protein kinase